jgi:polar amino acid transport system permease protein
MATAQAPVAVAQQPPDTRGPSAPLPRGILALGAAALCLVLLGTVTIQIWFAVAGGALTNTCVEKGLTHYDPASGNGIKGAEGICHMVTGVRSGAESAALWGGIALGVIALAIGFRVYRRMDTVRRREHAVAGAVLGLQGAVLGAFLLWFRSTDTVLAFVRNFLNFTPLRPYQKAFFVGAKNTVELAAVGEIGGIIIGLTLAMFILSSRRVVRAPARVYINFFRGTPLIWQLSFFYFALSLGLGLHLGAYIVAMIVFSLNTGAYASEVFRAGIQSIERGQIEAARGLGFSYLQAMRFCIVPQAVRRVIPPLLNEFVILIKDTSLVIVLGLLATQYDLYSTAQNAYSDTFYASAFVAAAIGYLVVTLPMIGVVNNVERRLRSGLVGIGGQAGM